MILVMPTNAATAAADATTSAAAIPPVTIRPAPVTMNASGDTVMTPGTPPATSPAPATTTASPCAAAAAVMAAPATITITVTVAAVGDTNTNATAAVPEEVGDGVMHAVSTGRTRGRSGIEPACCLRVRLVAVTAARGCVPGAAASCRGQVAVGKLNKQEKHNVGLTEQFRRTFILCQNILDIT